MRYANDAAASAFRVLDKYADKLETVGPWRWSCVVRNGALLPIAASLDEGFLQLACRPETIRESASVLERALMGNNTLPGGVRMALNSSSRGLHLRTDIAVLEEQQLLDRFKSALEGFHHGVGLMKSLDGDSRGVRGEARLVAASSINLGELLCESSWSCAERGANDFSAQLAADSAPPARIRMTENGLDLSVELIRANAAEVCRHALAVFLLTISSALRLARAYAAAADGQHSFGFQVNLPAAPAAEEIDHALAALSIAYRMCARETSVLLNEAAARCYLAARDLSTTNDHQHEEEN
jgi:hypothetical protein